MRPLGFFSAFVCTACLSAAATFTWTGSAGDHNYLNPANWSGGVVPPNNGTATLVFAEAADATVRLPVILNVAQIQFRATSTPYTLDASSVTLLVVQESVSSAGVQRIGSQVTLGFAGAQTVQVDSGTLEFAGNLVGSGDLVKTGGGELRVSGVNLIAGGAKVSSGSIIFATSEALPVGSITSASGSYVGAENPEVLKGMLSQINASTYAGSIGLDTAPGTSSPGFYSDQIDLAAIPNYGGIGSTTVARLNGNLSVGANQDYRFGGGAGLLYVQSNLTNSGSSLQLHSAFGQPLTVVLQGSNNFGGSVSVLNSVLVLDSQQAVSNNKILQLDGAGYIGATERYSGTIPGFLSQLKIASPNAVAGFDASESAGTRTISAPIDLSAGGTRTDPYYLGTSSAVTLTGKITPTTGDALYLTAVKGGRLTVASTLGSDIPSVVVGQEKSFDLQGGTVELTGRNNYTGGTHVLGGTLRAGNSSALGTGAVSVVGGATLDVSSGITLTNALSLSSGARLSGSGTLASAGGITLASRTILAPGGNGSVGTLSFATPIKLGSGVFIDVDVLDPQGTPGNGWDLITAYNTVFLTSDPTSPIVIRLASLSPAGGQGTVSGFDANQSYSWLFLMGDINGFSANKFLVDSSAFSNPLGHGTFSVSQGVAGLSVTFTPVPEPATYVLLLLGLVIVSAMELRRRH